MKIPQHNKRCWIIKALLRRTGTTLPDFKVHYRATVIKTVWPWYKKDRSMEQNKSTLPLVPPEQIMSKCTSGDPGVRSLLGETAFQEWRLTSLGINQEPLGQGKALAFWNLRVNVVYLWVYWVELESQALSGVNIVESNHSFIVRKCIHFLGLIIFGKKETS